MDSFIHSMEAGLGTCYHVLYTCYWRYSTRIPKQYSNTLLHLFFWCVCVSFCAIRRCTVRLGSTYVKLGQFIARLPQLWRKSQDSKRGSWLTTISWTWWINFRVATLQPCTLQLYLNHSVPRSSIKSTIHSLSHLLVYLLYILLLFGQLNYFQWAFMFGASKNGATNLLFLFASLFLLWSSMVGMASRFDLDSFQLDPCFVDIEQIQYDPYMINIWSKFIENTSIKSFKSLAPSCAPVPVCFIQLA